MNKEYAKGLAVLAVISIGIVILIMLVVHLRLKGVF